MVKGIHRSFRSAVCWTATSVFLLSPQVYGRDDDDLTELEEFIAEETAVEAEDSMLPTSRPVDSVFGAMGIMDIPRSVTVLTPEMMKQFNITDFHDLDKVGAGTQRVNFYGLPGTPWMRGDIAGSFFNGMLRAYNRNDMPVSFGALEAIDIVKGPAPAHFSPTQAGGYVNQLPKSPYFDEFRGSLKIEVGTYDHYNLKGDIGGPFLLGNKPAAFRISATGQRAGSYYKNLRNDFVSFYGSMKVKLRDSVTVFLGGEYFNFNSNENAGWNRITQDLIDHGDYIIGEPEDGTSPLWDNTFPKSDSPFVLFHGPPTDHSTAPSAFGANPALVVPFDIVESAGLPSGALSLLEVVPDQGYRYTLDYLNHPDSIVFTKKIEGRTVLTDPNDFADSQDFLLFFNYQNSVNPNWIIKNQFLLESLTTDKLSSYGYAFAIRQLVIENKLTVETNFGTHTNLVIGGSVRFLDGKQLQDFDTEPFARRDNTRDQVSSNSVIKVGPQRQFQEGDAALGCPPEGCNLWATFVSANADSQMFQFGAFAYMRNEISDRISVTTSVRGEFADWKSGVPIEVERNPQRGEVLNDSDSFNVMASIGPVIRIAPGITLYGSAQIGTAFEPTQGGAVSAGSEEDNFSQSELYEGGLKFHILNDTLFATAAGYYWDKSRFDARTGTTSPLRSKGVEFELTWRPNDQLTLIASAGASRTHRRTPAGFRFADTDDGFWLPLVAGGLFAGGSQGRPDNNPDLILNGFPEVSANIFLRYRMPNGLGFGIGGRWRDTYFHNFDRTLVIPSAVIFRGNISYTTERWDLLLTVENFTSEDWFLGSEPIFAANSLLLKAPAATGKLTFTYKF